MSAERQLTPSRQYLAARREILAAFDSAKDRSSSHEVPTYHGVLVEDKIRDWLVSFLPKKFGVCAGYIVSPEITEHRRHPHFDVIIYDAINSPTLWVDDGVSVAKQSRAIPVEYVFALFEVKSTLDTTTINQAITHINDISKMAERLNSKEEYYKEFLPDSFFWGLIFIEVAADLSGQSSETIANKYLSQCNIRGETGIFVFRRTEQTSAASGIIKQVIRKSIVTQGSVAGPYGLIDSGIKKPVGVDVGVQGLEVSLGVEAMWTESQFVTFAFDLLALLNGTYRQNFASSLYGIELLPIKDDK